MTTYTVYDTQDSDWRRTGLTDDGARELVNEKNHENSRFGDRYTIVTDAEFNRYVRAALEGE